MYVSLNWVIIGSDNGLSPVRRQAIVWTNAGILLIGPWRTNFSEILIGIQTFSFKKLHLKTSSGKLRLFCLGLNELTEWDTKHVINVKKPFVTSQALMGYCFWLLSSLTPLKFNVNLVSPQSISYLSIILIFLMWLLCFVKWIKNYLVGLMDERDLGRFRFLRSRVYFLLQLPSTKSDLILWALAKLTAWRWRRHCYRKLCTRKSIKVSVYHLQHTKRRHLH